MANENQNLTNPRDLVDVGMLDYFRQQADERYARSQTSIVTVTDITALTAAQLDGLAVGDIVIRQATNKKYVYTVAYKDATAGELSLVYVDADDVKEVCYAKSIPEGGSVAAWAYTETKTARLSTISGKADRSELPTYATVAESQAAADELT